MRCAGCVSTLLTLVASMVWAQPPPLVTPGETLQRICGRVAEPQCDASTGVMTLLVEKGVSVDVESTSPGDVTAMRLLAGSLLFEQVCLTGHVVKVQTHDHLAQFAIASTADVSSQGHARPKGLDAPGISTPCDAGVQLPTVRLQVPPNYTGDALGAKIQGVVLVQALVGVDGRVKAVQLLRSLDSRLGLDEQALLAVQRWRFNPATKAGTPVPMVVSIALTLTLKR